MKNINFPSIALLSCLTLTSLYLLLELCFTNLLVEPIGSRDLIAFWSGTQLFLETKDPYQTENLLELQKSILPNIKTPQAFLNPPWTLPLYSLFLWLPFNYLRILLAITNIFLLFGSIYLCQQIGFLQRKISKLDILSTCLFLPFLMTAWYGQLSIVLLFFSLLAIYLLEKQQVFFSAIAITPLLLKPHLFLVFAIFFVFKILKHKAYRFAVYFILLFMSLASTAILYSPKIYSNWLNSDFSTFSYNTSTLVSQLRLLQSGLETTWPIYVVPGIAVIGSAWFLMKKQSSTSLLPIVLGLSVATAPYAWFYDFVLLIPLQLALNSKIQKLHSQRFIVLVALALLPNILVLIQGAFSQHMGSLFWMPWLMVLLVQMPSNSLVTQKTSNY